MSSALYFHGDPVIVECEDGSARPGRVKWHTPQYGDSYMVEVQGLPEPIIVRPDLIHRPAAWPGAAARQ